MLRLPARWVILTVPLAIGAAIAEAQQQPPQIQAVEAATIQTGGIEAASSRAEDLQPIRSSQGDNSVAITQRYEVASDALTSISAIVANVNQVLGFAAMEQSLGAGTNPWSDEKFRNTYDRLDGMLTTTGLLVAAASAFIPKDEGRSSVLGASLSLAGIGRLLGTLFGQQTGGKFEEKAAFVEFSRRAYDDLRGRYTITNEYITSNKSLLSDIASFRASTFDSARAKGPSEKKAAIISAGSFLTRLDLVMTQIPAMLQLYEQTVRRYCPQALDLSRSDPSNLGGAECRSQLPDQRRPFVLQGDAKRLILQAAVHLAELKANQEAANRVRAFTPTLRAALLGQ